VEPLNIRVDHAGYFLSRSDEAFAIIDQVGSPQVKVLFDIYHQQITEGDLIRRIRANIGAIGHFHAAGSPGRHELDDGEIDYPKIFEAISSLGFEGDIAMEYFPVQAPLIGLKKLMSTAAYG
jgi:hydroxypyruvate isomerase